MTWVWIVLGVVVGVPLALAGIGLLLPKSHTATRCIHLHARPEAAWALISDFAAWPSWNPRVKDMQRTDQRGREVWMLVDSSGTMPTEVVERQPPTRLVTRIADPKLPFGGYWTWDIAPSGDGCTVRITEDGEVYNPIFRALGRFVFGFHSTIEAYLRALARKLGETGKAQP